MKKLILFSAILLGLSACSQYTCPTYSQVEDDTKEAVQVVEKDI